ASKGALASAAGGLERDQRTTLSTPQRDHGRWAGADPRVVSGRSGGGRWPGQSRAAAPVRRNARGEGRADRSRFARRSRCEAGRPAVRREARLMPGVLLIAEAAGDQLSSTTAELVAEGGRLAQQLGGGPVSVLLAGTNAQTLAGGPGQLGGGSVLVAGSPGLNPASSQWLLAAAELAAIQVRPEVILLSHAGSGRDLGPSLAYRLGAGVVTDSTALRVESGELVITKPVFGGSAIAEFGITSTPKVVTLRPRAFESAD